MLKYREVGNAPSIPELNPNSLEMWFEPFKERVTLSYYVQSYAIQKTISIDSNPFLHKKMPDNRAFQLIFLPVNDELKTEVSQYLIRLACSRYFDKFEVIKDSESEILLKFDLPYEYESSWDVGQRLYYEDIEKSFIDILQIAKSHFNVPLGNIEFPYSGDPNIAKIRKQEEWEKGSRIGCAECPCDYYRYDTEEEVLKEVVKLR